MEFSKKGLRSLALCALLAFPSTVSATSPQSTYDTLRDNFFARFAPYPEFQSGAVFAFSGSQVIRNVDYEAFADSSVFTHADGSKEINYTPVLKEISVSLYEIKLLLLLFLMSAILYGGYFLIDDIVCKKRR